jgi:hypothetical protein
MKLKRLLSILTVLTVLVIAPGAAMAQNFPSQQGGSTPSGQGGFPSQQGGQGGFPSQRGSFYQSQAFGFTLNFADPWTLAEQIGGPNDGFEGVIVTDGSSVVSLIGVTDSNTPQVIVQDVADNLGTPMEFMEVAVDEPQMAAAYYISGDGEMGARIFATTLSPSTAFIVAWLFPSAEYEVESERYNTLLDGLQLAQ